MTQEWYLKRINNLDVNSIRNLDYISLARLTCGFNPLFVGRLILRGLNFGQQRLILQHINNKYITWKRELNPKNEPSFYQKLYDYVDLSIKCGMMFRPEELDKFISDAGINTITGVKNPETTAAFEERIKELEEKNKRLNSENKELKEQLTQKPTAVENTEAMDSLKKENERISKEHEEMIVELLKPIFYKSEQDVKEFLEKIDGRPDTEIIDTVCEFLKARKISDKSKGRSLWSVLHAAKYYRATEANWNITLRNHP